MASAKRPVSIEGIEFDALIDVGESYSSDVPSYPVESGFEVSDTIILKPLSLSMTLFLTNTPVTWKNRFGSNPSRVQDVIKQLQQLYFQKKPVTVTTSERTYKNMAITSFELSKTLDTGSSREIPITFQEIRVTESKKTTIPDSYGKSGDTGTNAGTASTTSSSTPGASPSATQDGGGGGGSGNSNSSILYNLASGAGVI